MPAAEFTTRCPQCEEILRVVPELIGKPARCRTCRTRFVVSSLIFPEPPYRAPAPDRVKVILEKQPVIPAPTAVEPDPAVQLAWLDPIELEQHESTVARRARPAGRRSLWLRLLMINAALACLTSLPVWLLREPRPDKAVVHWVIDSQLLDPRYQILIDGRELAPADAEIDQVIGPGAHTLVVRDKGRERQRRTFQVTAGDRLNFRVFAEEKSDIRKLSAPEK